MSVNIGAEASGLLPFSTDRTSTLDQTQAHEQDNVGFEQNRYTGGQEALQGQVTGGLGAYLNSGNMPSGFTGLSQAEIDAAMLNFNRMQVPMLAAQHGSGSPAIQSAQQDFLLQLAAMGHERGAQNYINAYNVAGQYAFTPVGQDREMGEERLGSLHQTENVHETGFDPGGALESLLYAISNGGSSPAQPFP